MRYNEERYGGDDDYVLTRPRLTPAQVSQVTSALNAADVGQISPPQVTADQNNYKLPDGELIRLTTDASRTFTGFSPPRLGRFVICNVGAQDVVIANNSASSVAVNRVLCHTAANITLNPNESVEIIYDFASSKWRTIGFV
jgi:hypothetical protein